MFRRYSPFFARGSLEGRELSEPRVVRVESCCGHQRNGPGVSGQGGAARREEGGCEDHSRDGVLTIEGERKHEKAQSGEHEIRVESFYGRFARTFSPPQNVDSSNIRAESRDGILRVHIPKTANAPKVKTDLDRSQVDARRRMPR